MNSIAFNLNNILTQWKQEHDIFSAITSEFTISSGFLCFAGSPLCQDVSDLALVSADFDAESIQYFLSGNRSITLTIIWPEDQPPVISSVSFAYHFYNEGIVIG